MHEVWRLLAQNKLLVAVFTCVPLLAEGIELVCYGREEFEAIQLPYYYFMTWLAYLQGTVDVTLLFPVLNNIISGNSTTPTPFTAFSSAEKEVHFFTS